MAVKPLDFAGAEKALGVKLIENGKATQAVHEVVVAYQANRRAGTHSTLTKATVKCSGRKPWRQKGTGNARAGTAASPLWRGGGVVFGPQPRDYSKKTSKKLRKLALKKAISEAVKSDRVQTVDAIDASSGKTKDFAKWIKDNKLSESLLIVMDVKDETLLRVSRNLPKVEIVLAADLNAEQLLRYRGVVLIEKAAAILSERLK